MKNARVVLVESVGEIADQIRNAHSRITTKIIAIDGCGGAGKSTFANKLSSELNQCPIIHTDDFASWDNPLNWFERMVDQVLLPLSLNRTTQFQRYDWNERRLSDWIKIDPTDFLIIEGVSSARKEFRTYLSFSVFVQTDHHLRLQRGLARDGEAAHAQWLEWMKAEDEYLSEHRPQDFVDLVISGDETKKI